MRGELVTALIYKLVITGYVACVKCQVNACA